MRMLARDARSKEARRGAAPHPAVHRCVDPVRYNGGRGCRVPSSRVVLDTRMRIASHCLLIWVQLVQLVDAGPAPTVLVRPWGENALRVQIAPPQRPVTDQLPTGYVTGSSPAYGSALPQLGVDTPVVVSGNIKASVDLDGMLRFTRVSDSAVLLQQTGQKLAVDSAMSVTFDFSVSATEVYGMGQNRHEDNGGGLGLNVLGNSYNFGASIGEEGGPSNTLPFALGANATGSAFQWGVLFNSPALGGVNFTASSSTWWISDAGNPVGVGEQAVRRQFDFLVTTHSANARPEQQAFQIVQHYVDAVGHAQPMPWTGYWHSKNRYASQDELLEAARGFYNRSVPVDVIVIDYMHWKIQGDWSFDPAHWPDPQAMVDECTSMGIEIMVSVWPFTCPNSRSYDTIVDNQWLTTYLNQSGSRSSRPVETHGKSCYLVDVTNPEFRKYCWSLIESGYYRYGIKLFWLDASEPEGFETLALNASWQAGSMRDLASMFTLYWTQVFYDGLQEHNETEIAMLSRASWVGTWRHGAVLWSGDIGSTLEVLKSQINIGISAQISGIPYWTTDIGGYGQGHAEDPEYRETVTRWFQYGLTCPVFRQHGARDYTCPWYYGPQAEAIIEDTIRLRYQLKSYIAAQLNQLHVSGRPFNRPLSWDFPLDAMTWELAKHGIGDTNQSVWSGPLSNKATIELTSCITGDLNQSFRLVQDASTNQNLEARKHVEAGIDNASLMIQIGQGDGSPMCLDSGGAPKKPLHLWKCAGFRRSHQTWLYDEAKKSITEANMQLCLSAYMNRPVLMPCNDSAHDQQWYATVGGTGGVRSGSGQCLTVMLPPPPGGPVGVIDQYMMGDDYMAAPILNLGQRSRMVYFPRGADWVHHYTDKIYRGGTIDSVEAPLDHFPLFRRTAASTNRSSLN